MCRALSANAIDRTDVQIGTTFAIFWLSHAVAAPGRLQKPWA
jgi:hypothetical protein